ncbi:TetR/AcrR family transcriptional regulator [Rhodococcus triatomae]|uniref:DNA-binding transcriptional regulator, AcrR family n=1 Tax=Rhodococcus triatomae TaxID=300028 RepID=A0A1G8JEJ8_9NOCA|nr:TetR/AcrR family transcriptional regulator [Rhodococcus triatomae]QNG19737.1 TetR/AcrR family transcriptional regulator [Rhodococcus triatomae]QNG24347.1 TetR/AcrR family transcriptional regulator [Rhodococcus triatomae]SDI29625.1 DNA-binding transcriptional regulator, AcrR family [Rhodococcus triatomae]
MSRRQENTARLRAELLDAARTVLSVRGYVGTSVADIATESGHSHAEFDEQFDSMEAVLLALAEEIAADSDAIATRTPAGTDIGPYLQVLWQVHSRHRAALDALDEAALVDRDFAAGMRDFWAVHLKPWSVTLERLAESGATLPGSPLFTTLLLDTITREFVSSWEGTDPDGLAALTRFVESGLLGD